MQRTINRVFLVGHIARPLSVKVNAQGKRVGQLALATHSSRVQKDTTQWHRVILSQALSDEYEHRLHKGELVFVEGQLRYALLGKAGQSPSKQAFILAKRLLTLA